MKRALLREISELNFEGNSQSLQLSLALLSDITHYMQQDMTARLPCVCFLPEVIVEDF